MNINNFDKIYYINCDHRQDRLLHINSVLKRLNIDESKIERIPAIYIEDNGSLGCAQSHLLALNKIKSNKFSKCLILEDDFMPINYSEFDEKLGQIFSEKFDDKWDLVMLSGNIFKSEESNYSEINKVIDVQTTSAYAISLKFVDILIENFEESAEMLRNGQDRFKFAIDQNWKKIQPIHNWYIFNPQISRQIDDYSDIEKRNVSYRC